jgi:hypothetical protein
MTLRPSIQLDLARPIANNHYLNISRSFDATWILLASNKDFGRSAPPFEYEVSQFDGRAWHSALAIGPTGRQYFNAERLPDNRWLLIAGRTDRQIPNGDIFDKNGNLTASLNLGDGIEHVQATHSGDIWIGYCDEGIFGGGDLAQEGLICLSQGGIPKVRFFREIVDVNSVPSIDDCYALNVCRNGDTWVCYYRDFPVVRIKHYRFDESWADFPARPVSALAVNGEKLLMVPAYRHLGPLYFCDLQSRLLEQVQFVNNPGQSIDFDAAIGRDATLGFISLKDRPILYQLDFG